MICLELLRQLILLPRALELDQPIVVGRLFDFKQGRNALMFRSETKLLINLRGAQVSQERHLVEVKGA